MGCIHVLKSYVFGKNIDYGVIDIMLPLIQAKIKLILLVIIMKCWFILNILLKHTFYFSARFNLSPLYFISMILI